MTIFPAVNKYLLFIKREVSRVCRHHPDENRKSQLYQKQLVEFDLESRQDLHFIRAFLSGIHKFWVPITSPTRSAPVIPDLLVHTDASGQVEVPAGCCGPALGINIPTQKNTIARAASFPLPMQWLLSEDSVGKNHWNTLYLEGKPTRQQRTADLYNFQIYYQV